jgi:hypothetical protein
MGAKINLKDQLQYNIHTVNLLKRKCFGINTLEVVSDRSKIKNKDKIGIKSYGKANV